MGCARFGFSSSEHSGGMNLLDAFTGDFMKAFGGYATSWFPMFMLGAIFGKVMEVTGAAESIAHFLAKKIGYKRAIIAVVVICGVLTYGGVSLFVVVFVMYPMGLALFREANLPRKMLPGSIAFRRFRFYNDGVSWNSSTYKCYTRDLFRNRSYERSRNRYNMRYLNVYIRNIMASI